MTQASETATPQATLEEVVELIEEFEKYRERLLNDALDAAKRAKLSKKATLERLEPELAKIDESLQHLREQQASLSVAALSEA
jgi:chromosome segregation ATPase